MRSSESARIHKYCFPAFPGRHEQNVDVYSLGGPEVPFKTFCQIHISWIVPMYHKQAYAKFEKSFM